jgi:hypothetical protein
LALPFHSIPLEIIMTTSPNDNGFNPDAPDRLAVGPCTYVPAGHIRFGCYASGEIALEIVDENEETLCVATVALVPYGAPHPGEYAVWLKGWSENDGVPKALIDAGIVTLTGRRHAVGYSQAQHAQLTERARAALQAKRNSLTQAAHREVDALERLGLFGRERSEELKRFLNTEAIEQHDRDGMSVREIVDMYRDLTDSP